MIEQFGDFLLGSKEYQAGLWSIATIGFAMSVALTIWPQIFVVRKQLREMQEARSVAGVSGVMLILTFVYNGIFFLYSLEVGILGGLFNAVVLAIPYYLLVREYWGRAEIDETLSPLDWFAAVGGGLLIIVAVWPPFVPYAYKVISLSCLVGVASQPIKMWWNDTTAGVNSSFMAGYAVVCAVWALYSAATQEWFITGYSSALAVCFVAAYVMCHTIRPRTA